MMAPGYSEEAKAILMAKKNRRLLTIDSSTIGSVPRGQVVRKPIEGGVIQTEEPPVIDWEKATKSPSVNRRRTN